MKKVLDARNSGYSMGLTVGISIVLGQQLYMGVDRYYAWIGRYIPVFPWWGYALIALLAFGLQIRNIVKDVQ